MVLELKSRTIQ